MLDSAKLDKEIAALEGSAKRCLAEDVSWLQLDRLGSGSNFGEQVLKWQASPRYFTEVKISSLALMRMAEHAQNGGSQEVMGVLTGVIRAQSFVVLDCFALPVEATETRVNAMAEGYEFMVQYLQSLQALGRTEHIVGWYHSHPGYGCWLSGIDVRTQMQNQAFQDPFVALVIDPVRTARNSQVDIGAFRTFPDALGPASQATQERPQLTTRKSFQEPQPPLQTSAGSGNTTAGPGQGARYAEFGAYADAYYQLAISYFSLPPNDLLMSGLQTEDWIADLVSGGGERASMRTLHECTKSAQELARTVTETAHSLANGQNNAPQLQSIKIQRLSDRGPDLSTDHHARTLGSADSVYLRRHQQSKSSQSDHDSIGQRLTASLNAYRAVTARARSTASERELRRELFRG